MISNDKSAQTMDFTVVILSENTSSYPNLSWSEWKDSNRMKMKSQGDYWSKTTLSGNNILDCLSKHKINDKHLVQWKEAGETLYKVSLPSPL